MGVQEISEKKTRQAALETGLPLFRCLRHSNRLWYGFVRAPDGHWHVALDPSTWEWRVNQACLSSCTEGHWGPYVQPPSGMRYMTWLSGELAQAEKMIEWMKGTLDFYASPATYEERIVGKDVYAPDGVVTERPIEDDRGMLARAAVAAIVEHD